MYAGSFDVRLHLRGPLVSHSSAIGGFGLDTVMAKTKDASGIEHYFLAGTLIKGLLGEAWQELGHEDWRNRYLGHKSEERNKPKRGKIFFSDFLDRQASTKDLGSRFRIQINREMGSVEHGMVQAIEAPWRPGAPVVFHGTVRLLAASAERADEMRTAVERGLNWVAAAGAQRSCGFGRVTGVECLALQQAETGADILDEQEFALDLTITESFCLALRRVTYNMFASSEIIPGGALKGVVAEMLEMRGAEYAELHDSLHAVRFYHAFPVRGAGPRPEVLPLSLALIPDDTDSVYNAVHGPGMIEQRELAFDIDWKEHEATRIRESLGWSSPDVELRVRTEIEGARRKAEDKNLFAYRMIVPHGFVWRGGVSLLGVDAARRADVSRQLQELLSFGLFGLGKTKAWAKANCVRRRVPEFAPKADERLIVTLQTSALLCQPSRFLALGGDGGQTSVRQLKMEYEHVWQELGEGSVELEDYFQRNELAGGGYFRNRFQKDLQYRPYLLTEAGSVFVLCVKDAELAAKKAREWLALGLSIPAGTREFYHLAGVAESEWWDHCPFVRENGYGEVTIDSPTYNWARHQLKTQEGEHV